MFLEQITNATGHNPLGVWIDNQGPACFTDEAVLDAVTRFREPAWLVRSGDQPGTPACLGVLPAGYPEWLGGRNFTQVHGVRFPYVSGAMARGIASAEMVIAMGQSQMLGFFGSAGLSHARVEAALDQIEAALGHDRTWGCNIINSITDPAWEEGLVDILLRRGVRRASASAYMELTPALVRYAFTGVHLADDGTIVRRNYVFAKISRPDVAVHFMSPPPAAILDGLVLEGGLTAEEARLARELPVAEDYIVESDSGGHTDNQPLPALFPTITQLRQRCIQQYGYTRPIRVGAAGGLGTPATVASAFALGAEFVVTGSVNECTVEAGISEDAKAMLAQAGLNDFAMCPCADMFELGVKVQVLKRGTMFPVRATMLYSVFTTYKSLETIPAEVSARLEKQIFRQPLTQIWESTAAFFQERNPAELERAQRDPKYKMALVFRWYLGQSSHWPIRGQQDRAVDYQIWGGPALGAFNDWVLGTFLEDLANRTVVQVALNLLEGAAAITRAHQLRSFGLTVPEAAFHFQPRPLI